MAEGWCSGIWTEIPGPSSRSSPCRRTNTESRRTLIGRASTASTASPDIAVESPTPRPPPHCDGEGEPAGCLLPLSIAMGRGPGGGARLTLLLPFLGLQVQGREVLLMPELPLTIAEAAEWLRSGRITSVGLTEAQLARAHATQDTLAAFIHIMDDVALAGARQADA